MSEGAANEARVVISTDYQTMKDFVEFTEKKLNDIKEKGKGSFGEIAKASTQMGGVVQGALMGVGMQLFDAIVTPMRKGFGELIRDAENLRKTVTTMSIAAGDDFKRFEDKLNALRRKTGEGVEPIKNFVRDVAGKTGNWDQAFGAVEGAKKEAIARGYGSVSEMAGETAQLQRRYGVKAEDTEAFYDAERSRAAALGLNPNLSAETSKRMRSTYEGAGMTGEAVGRWSNALLRASGGNADRALEAGQEFKGAVQGAQSRGVLEQTLGLKQGGLLDKEGLPDVARAIDLMQKFQGGKRGQKGLEHVARQHFSPGVAKLFSQGMPEITSAYEAQNYVEAGRPLSEAGGKFYSSEQGRSELNAQRLAIENEKAGKPLASYKERVLREMGGGVTGFADPLKSKRGWQAILGADPDAPPSADSRRNVLGDIVNKERERLTPHATTIGDGELTEGKWQSGPGFGGMSPPSFAPTPTDPRQLAIEQAKKNAEALQMGAAIPIRGTVTVEFTTPAPTAGQGGQR